jgi:hypothetical protein
MEKPDAQGFVLYYPIRINFYRSKLKAGSNTVKTLNYKSTGVKCVKLRVAPF